MSIYRLFYWLLITLVLALIIHIIALFSIPFFTPKNTWEKNKNTDYLWKFHHLTDKNNKATSPNNTASDRQAISSLDPSFTVAICAYDLQQFPALIGAEGHVPFWSTAIFNDKRDNIYSYNSTTAKNQKLSLIIATPAQIAQLHKTPSLYDQQTILIESQSQKGFILLRVLQKDLSWEGEIREFVNNARCTQLLY